jgi:hypothetical protein
MGQGETTSTFSPPGHGGPAPKPAEAELTPAVGFADGADGAPSGWEPLWIDLGGEG